MNEIPNRRRGWRVWLPASLLLLFAACAPENEYQPPPPPEVTVAKPLQQTVTHYLEETGWTEAKEVVEIRARVRGFIEKIEFEQGDDVGEGDDLYTIEKKLYEADVKRLEAAVEVAKAEFDNLDARYKRAVPLVEKDVITREELEERKAERDVAEAKIQSAEAELATAKINLGYTDIKSPIKGRVGKTLVKQGNLVDGMEGTHLTTVINYDPIYANFNISETDLLKLRDKYDREGKTKDDLKQLPLFLARSTDTGFPFEGRFDYSDLGVDQGTGTFLVRGLFPNPDQKKIVPGLFVRIRVPVGEFKDALLVPRAALGFDQEGRYVLVVNGEKKVERRNVELGPELGDLQVILGDSLKPDEWVIVRGVQRAREGAVVSPQQTTLPPWQGDATVVQPDAVGGDQEAQADRDGLDQAVAPLFDGGAERTQPDDE